MNLELFLDNLADVEFSQHTLLEKDEQGRYINYKKLINLINRATDMLHNRFLIKKGEIFLNICKYNKLRYNLKDESYYLGLDNTRELIKILEVWADDGTRCNLNPLYRDTINGNIGYYDVQMMDQFTLVFGQCRGCYRIIFQKGPKYLEVPDTIEEFYPEDMEIDISKEFIDALSFYIASRMFSVNPPLEGYGAQFSPSIMYTRKYEEECDKLQILNLEIDGLGLEADRFQRSNFP